MIWKIIKTYLLFSKKKKKKGFPTNDSPQWVIWLVPPQSRPPHGLTQRKLGIPVSRRALPLPDHTADGHGIRMWGAQLETPHKGLGVLRLSSREPSAISSVQGPTVCSVQGKVLPRTCLGVWGPQAWASVSVLMAGL